MTDKEALVRQADLHNMQLAAISTASMQNTRSTIVDRVDPSSSYWTQAYANVCRAVDREILHREESERLRTQVKSLLDEQVWEESVRKELQHKMEQAQARVAQLEKVVLINHNWHLVYDEHGGYPDSELYHENAAALGITATI